MSAVKAKPQDKDKTAPATPKAAVHDAIERGLKEAEERQAEAEAQKNEALLSIRRGLQEAGERRLQAEAERDKASRDLQEWVATALRVGLSLRETASLAGISRQTIYYWQQEGAI